MRKSACLVVLALLVGCVDDPRDPKMWIKKLDDPRDRKEAVTQLVKLKDPVAVEPLINHYKNAGKDPEVLKALATFKDKRAAPLFLDSLDYTEDTFEAAAASATALGELGDPSAYEPLAKTLGKPLSIKSRANLVKIEAMKALVEIHKAGGGKNDKVVDALVKVLGTPADDQDFLLNQTAAKSLGEFADPRAADMLVRGLFMTGRGTDIYQPCRVSLLMTGAAAVKPLMDAFQHKNAGLEEDAKKYEFRPGIIEQKTALILGDLRAKQAIPLMVAELKKPMKGDNHRGAMYALGIIGDPSTTKDLVGIMNDAKRDWEMRVMAANMLNFTGDASAMPALLNIAKTGDIVKQGEKYPDLRMAAAQSYSRLGGAAEAAAFAPVLAAEKVLITEFKQCNERLELAKKCKKDLACYGAALDDKSLYVQEKAAFMLAQAGKAGLPFLVKKIGAKEPSTREPVLFGIAKNADKTATDAKKALETQIDVDKTKPPIKALVDEMRATLAIISSRG